MSQVAAVPAPAAREHPLTGTAILLRSTLRHDGRYFAPWVVIVTALSASSVLVYPWVFPTAEDRAGLAATVGANPALGLIFGPAYDLTTADGFNAWRALALGGFFAALGAIFAVVRATRAQEDSGQAELLASGVLGRGSRLVTGVAAAGIGSVLLGVVSALVTVWAGGGWAASMLLGTTFTATGWMFTGVTALSAQLGSDARAANSIAVGTLGALFVLRGFAYSVDAPAWTTWANPLSWMTQTRPGDERHWWPLALAVALAAALLAVAFVLQARRDFGQGFLPSGPGPARGRMTGVAALALRLNRGQLLTWAIAFAILGTVFGNFTTSIIDILTADSALQQVFASGAATPEQLLSRFMITILSLVGIIAAVVGVQVLLKARSEELADRVEPVLAGDVPRWRYLGAQVALAALASTGALLLAAVVIGAIAAGADIGVAFADVLVQAVATAPAVWTIVAISVAVVGARPEVSLAPWAGVVASFALTLLGPTFGLDDWVLGISPFWHVPDVTATNVDLSGLGWISLVTAGLIVVGFVGFRRRDLAR